MSRAKKPTPKKRANKYQEKVKVNGTFDELMGALFPKPPDNMLPPKISTKKSATKKKIK